MKHDESLAQLRELCNQSRALLIQPDLQTQERQALEHTLAQLHSAERLLHLKEADTGEQLEETANQLKLIATELREIASKLNKQSKALDQLQKLIQRATTFLQAFTEWK